MPDGTLRHLPFEGAELILESSWSRPHPGEYQVKHVLFRVGPWFHFSSVLADGNLTGLNFKDFYEHLEESLRYFLGRVKEDRNNYSNYKDLTVTLPIRILKEK